MTKYIVVVIAKAKDTNPSFPGQTAVFVYGKNEHMLARGGDHYNVNLFGKQKLWKSDVREYGYSRECDAKRSYIYTHSACEQYWDERVKVVPFEC